MRAIDLTLSPHRTWDKGRDYCRDHGYRMVKIVNSIVNAQIGGESSGLLLLCFPSTHSYDPPNTMYTGLMETARGSWLGAHRSDGSSEQWRWEADGSAVTFTKWTDGQPSNLANEKCAFINFYGADRWADTVCTANLDVLCQRLPI